MKKLADDVYDFGFILLEALVGPIVTGKGESFLLSEMVRDISLISFFKTIHNQVFLENNNKAQSFFSFFYFFLLLAYATEIFWKPRW